MFLRIRSMEVRYICTMCEFCGALRFDEIGDSGDSRDSEDLFLKDEGL